MRESDTLRDTLHRIEEASALDAPAKVLEALAEPLTRSTPMKNALSGAWLGHRLHPLLTDVPIGAWLGASFLDVFGGRHSGKAARRLVALGIVSAVPTAMAGLSDWSDTHGGEQRVATVHALANTSALVLQTLSWRARGRGHAIRGRFLSTLALGAVVAGGYLGGILVYNMRAGVDAEQAQLPPGTWSDAVALDELVDDTPHGVVLDGAPVVIVRHRGDVYALGGRCTHAGGPLGDGRVEGAALRCPWHGSEFRLVDGRVLRGPATTPEPAYDTRVQDGIVQVRAGTGEEAVTDLTVV